MNRIGRLLRLICLMILSTGSSGCAIEQFEVSISDPFGLGEGNATGQDDQAVDSADSGPHQVCWPDKTAMAAELRSHGYRYQAKDWKATADWFARLAPLAKSLPACE